MVGTAARIRVSSLIAPSCIGTLKSTLTSTRLSCKSMSRMVCLSSAIIGNLCFGWRIQLRQMHEKPIIRSLLGRRMIGIKGHVATNTTRGNPVSRVTGWDYEECRSVGKPA